MSRPGVDHPAQRRDQLLGLVGLVQECGEAVGVELARRGLLAVSADQDDGQVRADLAQGAEQLRAVAVGHRQVDHRGVEFARPLAQDA